MSGVNLNSVQNGVDADASGTNVQEDDHLDINSSSEQQNRNGDASGNGEQQDENATATGNDVEQDENADENVTNVQQDDNLGATEENIDAIETSVQQEDNASGTSVQQDASGTITQDASSTNVQQDASGTIAQQDASGTTVQQDASGTNVQQDASGTDVQQDASGTTVQPDASVTEVQQDASGTTMQQDETVDAVGSDKSADAGGTEVQPDTSGTEVQQYASGTEVQQDASGTEVQQDASGSEVQQDASGTEVQQDASGSEVQQDASGTEVQQDASGSEVQHDASGSEVQQDASGSEVQQDAIGTEVQQDASGSEVQQDASDSEVQQDASGSEVQQDASGSEVQQDASGSEVQQDASGTEVQQDASGSEVQQDASGSEVQQYASGSEVQQDASGSEVQQDASGSEVQQYASGSEVQQDASGSEVQQDASGTEVQQDASGSEVQQDASGTKVQQDASGSEVQQDASGSEVQQDASGTEVQQDASGSEVQQDASGTEVQQDASGSEVQQDASGSEVQQDASGSEVQQDASGTEVQQDASGSEVQQDASGTEVQQDASGSEVQHDASGTKVQQGASGTEVQPGVSGTDVQPNASSSSAEDDIVSQSDDIILQPPHLPVLQGRKASALSKAVSVVSKQVKARSFSKSSMLPATPSDESSDNIDGVPVKRQDEESELAAYLQSGIYVKLLLVPRNELVTVTSELRETVWQIKEWFSRRLKIEPIILKMKLKDKVLSNETRMVDLGIEPNGTVHVKLESRDPEHFPLENYRRDSYIPDLLSIDIINRKGEDETVIVEVLQPTRTKPYLGGYRNKVTCSEFHNASSQTKPIPLTWPKKELFTRDTQTRQFSNQIIQTPQDASTQMTKIGCYVSLTGNKLKTPGKYVSAKQNEDSMLEKVIILQKHTRRYLAWKYVMSVRKQKEKKIMFDKEEALNRKLDKENRIKAEFQRRQCPRSRKDFNTLYEALEKWRLQEIAKINETLTGAERKAALYMLLNKEMEHLAAIGRHQAIADEVMSEKKIQTFLDKTAAPRSMISGYDKKVTLIDTPYTIRARELQEIYNSLIINNVTLDERLDILLTLKYTVKEHNCRLCYGISRLIDREADLLMRGVSNNSLSGLRKRIATLFLQYIETPIFNPEAARFVTLPPLSKSKKVYYCASCNKYYSSSQFPLNVNAQVPGPCKMCKSKDNEGRLRIDFNIYKYMLKSLRAREERFKDNSTIAFLIQDSDIYYLVEKIWNSESVISNCKDLYDLIWIRWDKAEVWSPWNCLLVTVEEAECHNKFEDIQAAYGEVFLNKIHQKHLLAKSYFSRLPWLEKEVNKPALRKSFSTERGAKFLSKQTSCNLFPSG